jgi:hypothetical protein
MYRRNMVMQVSLSFFFNAKENIQQNIYISKCVINLILALNPDAYFGTEKVVGGERT